MPDDIEPPTCAETDLESTAIDVESLSDTALGAAIRQQANKRNAKFVKTFYAKVGGNWALHYTLVRKP